MKTEPVGKKVLRTYEALLYLVFRGLSIKAAARRLGYTPNDVRFYCSLEQRRTLHVARAFNLNPQIAGGIFAEEKKTGCFEKEARYDVFPSISIDDEAEYFYNLYFPSNEKGNGHNLA